MVFRKSEIRKMKPEIVSKSALVFVFIFHISYFIFAQEGFQKLYYPNGKISSEGTMHSGKPDGYWKSYYENGKLKSEGNRADFKLDSLWKFYNDSGFVTAEYNYSEGIRHGLQKTYYPNGIIQSEEVDSM